MSSMFLVISGLVVLFGGIVLLQRRGRVTGVVYGVGCRFKVLLVV